ncbi:spectrin binding protein [Aureococcus anophagefferens]|uniref:Spectrin binding protein n=1 Tax=Aureococcus anophagefferens TaxID=44056 RepID=A0ABR1FIA5_AURAN
MAGVDVTKPNEQGVTPLVAAVQLGRSDAVKLLLDAGAVETDSAELFYGQTAVFTAAAWGHLGIVRLLTEHGHDVERENVNGASAAMAAAERGHAGVLGFLIGAGADFQKADNAGVTPLYRAKKNGHKDVVALLLDAGAEELHADLPKRAWEAEPQPTGRTKTCKKAKSKQECKKVKSGGEKACKWKNDKCKAKGGDTGGSCEDNTSKGSCKKDALGCKWKNDKREAQTGLAAEAEQTRAEAAAALINAAKQDEARALEKAGRKAKAKAKARARQAELAAKVQRTREAARAREAELAAEAKAREAAAAREAELAAKQAREEARGLEAARARELSVKAAAETKAREQARAREAAAAREKAKAEARAGAARREKAEEEGAREAARRARRSWPPRRRPGRRRAREAAANAPTRVEPEACGAEEAKHADDDYDDARVVEILAGSGNASLVPLFREHEVDDGALLGLEADDLSDMGVAPAAALRILCAINAQRMAASKLAVNELADVPEDLLCCISCEIMKDPVSADDGNTYERVCVCIEQWFATGKRTPPRTNEPLVAEAAAEPRDPPADGDLPREPRGHRKRTIKDF